MSRHTCLIWHDKGMLVKLTITEFLKSDFLKCNSSLMKEIYCVTTFRLYLLVNLTFSYSLALKIIILYQVKNGPCQ